MCGEGCGVEKKGEERVCGEGCGVENNGPT